MAAGVFQLSLRRIVRRIGILSGFHLLVLAALGADQAAETFLPFFEPFEAEAAGLSRDGRYFASSRREQGGVSVYIMQLDEKKVVRVRLDEDKPDAVRGTIPSQVTALYWSGDWLVAQIVSAPHSTIVAMKADGTRLYNLFAAGDPEWRQLGTMTVAPPRVRLVAPQLDVPGHVAVLTKARHRRYDSLGIYRFNLETGTWERLFLEAFPGTPIFDSAGNLSATRIDNGVEQRHFYRQPKTSSNDWEDMKHFAAYRQTSEFARSRSNYFSSHSTPLGLNATADILYYASYGKRDTMGVYAIRRGMKEPELLAIEDDSFDVIDPENPQASQLIFDPADGRFMGVRYSGALRRAIWSDPALGELQKWLQSKNPGYSMEILGWDRKKERFLIRRYSRSDPGDHLVYEKPSDQVLARAPCAKGIRDRIPDATTQVWSIQREDGSTLMGTLTLPKAESSSGWPTVVLYPDAAWGHPSTDFSRDVAAFARMGYAVMEVHYRGTTGRGLKAWRAGREYWDKVATEDVMLAIDRHARNGLIDSKRIAVIGKEWGGYFAMRTMQLNPEQIACGIMIDALMDLEPRLRGRFSPLLSMLVIGERSRGLPSAVEVRSYLNGTISENAETNFFWPTVRGKSPCNHEKAVGRPVWLVESGKDLVFDHGIERMYKKMLSDGDIVRHTHETSTTDYEDDPAKKARFFANLQEFLARNLKESE